MLPKTILVTNKTNIRYLSGFVGTAGFLVVRGREGFLFTDARYHLVAKKVLPRSYRLIDTTDGFKEIFSKFLKKKRIRRIGIEGGYVSLKFWKYLKRITQGVKFIDIGDVLDEKRIVKKLEELRVIKKAQFITDRVFFMLKKWLRLGVSEKEIAWKIECLSHELGADDISFPAIVGINEHSASPHHHVTDRKLKRGDLVLIDMGVIYKGYCSDMTRVLFTKKPTAEQTHIYGLVLQAQETAIRNLKAGIAGDKMDNFARDVIEKAGYGKYFGHSLGHGVGLDIHELPNLAKKYKKKIPAGSVVTVEPGIYLPGKFGVRLEDMVIVKEKGVINITKSPKAIQDSVVRI